MGLRLKVLVKQFKLYILIKNIFRLLPISANQSSTHSTDFILKWFSLKMCLLISWSRHFWTCLFILYPLWVEISFLIGKCVSQPKTEFSVGEAGRPLFLNKHSILILTIGNLVLSCKFGQGWLRSLIQCIISKSIKHDYAGKNYNNSGGTSVYMLCW